jgi:membrane protease YdiL (CAAX protease family)
MGTVQIFLLILPLVLIGIMQAAFKGFHTRFGFPLGYLMAFVLYWFFWCLLIPTVFLGGVEPVIRLFIPAHSIFEISPVTHLFLWWPLVFPVFFMFLPRIRRAGAGILLLSLLLGAINGIAEEILWRGLFLYFFPGNLLWGILYPSILFGLWHICPQSILQNKLPGGVFSFVLYAILLGLTYAFAAGQTGSIFWPTVSHILHDTLGLGGFAYATWLVRPPAVEHR